MIYRDFASLPVRFARTSLRFNCLCIRIAKPVEKASKEACCYAKGMLSDNRGRNKDEIRVVSINADSEVR